MRRRRLRRYEKDMKKLHFSGKPLKITTVSEEPKEGLPFIYILTEKDDDKPFYIGECGKAVGYNVLGRIRRHFWKGSTLGRVVKNLPAFGHAIPNEFDAYIKELDGVFSDVNERQSLEAWLIYTVCHVKKVQSERFCVIKYAAPKETSNYSTMACEIINEFKEAHNKAMQAGTI